MKNDHKNPIYPLVLVSCMIKQLNLAVQIKTCKCTLEIHSLNLNLNLWFKSTQTLLLLAALAEITSYCHVIITHHIVHCIDCVLSMFAGGCSPLVDVCSDDEFNDTDEELHYLQKCQASKNPMFIPIQSHSLAPALFYCIRTTAVQLLHAAVVEPVSSA